MLALEVKPEVVSILASQKLTKLKLVSGYLKGHETGSLVLQGPGSCGLLLCVCVHVPIYHQGDFQYSAATMLGKQPGQPPCELIYHFTVHLKYYLYV